MFPIDPPLTPGARPTRYPSDDKRTDFDGYAAFVQSAQTDADLVKYARSMLAKDPENIWAMVVLADRAASDFEKVVLLREAIRVGEHYWKDWGPDQRGPTDARVWYKSEAAGDFLAAAARYAVEMHRMGLPDVTEECVAELLRIDPDDARGLAEAIAERCDGLSDGSRQIRRRR